MTLQHARTEMVFDAGVASGRLCAMATFRDGETSRRQIGTQLDLLAADFARCLAMSAWAIQKPLRMLAFALPMQTSLDACLLARLRDAGYALHGLDDETLAPALDSRWEFVRGNESCPSRYRPAPSYHERLRVELLIDAWQRASRRANGVDVLERLAGRLAAATAALSARLALPIALLRRASAERCSDTAAEERLRAQVRRASIDLPEDDVRHLAIAAALEDSGDIVAAVQRHGTPAMRVLLRAHLERAPTLGARVALESRLARVRRELWAPVGTCG